ncbi:MAG: AMP-binding protein [Acidimicrobiales bacterium]
MEIVPSLAGGNRVRDTPAAVTIDGRALDLAGLAGAAGAVATRLSGLPAVAVEATASLETVVAVLGGLMAGVPVIPVPPDSGPMERRHILSDCGAPVLLVPPGAAPPLPDGIDVEVLEVDVDERADWSPRAGDQRAADRVAMIVYTSGTTGLPKGVMISAGAIAGDLDALAGAWAWDREDVLVHGLPLFHVHGLVLGVLGALRAGSPLVHTGRPAPAAYAGAAAQLGGSLFFGVPTVWSRISADSAAASALRRARLLVSGSAGLPVPVFDRLVESAGQGPIERYGMTETLITVSGRVREERQAGWVGRPLPGVATRLVDDAGRPLPPDGEAVGDLEVRAPTVMRGYLNLPEATAGLTTQDGWVRTGDVACIDGRGWHRIVGRRSTDLIKSGGYRIGAGEVEAALLTHPGVTEAAVVGAPDDDLGQVVVAYVVAEGVTDKQLCDFVAGSLSVHKRPRRVELLAELPRNAMGKVQKQLLPRT